MDDMTEALRAYFEGLTDDSRPCSPGSCPMVAAGLARDNAHATTLAPSLVRAVDVYTRNTYGALQWHRLTAADVLDALAGWTQ